MKLTELNKGERKPVLYLDIDGTVRWGKTELGHFVNTKDDVRVFDGVPEILQAYKKAGWRILGISNQGGIALGIMTLERTLETMEETNRQCLKAFDKITFCPHHPDAKDPEWRVCWCRKPRAGMVIETAIIMEREYNEMYLPLLGVFVGDRPEDKGCADAANLRFMDATEWRDGGWRKFLEAPSETRGAP